MLTKLEILEKLPTATKAERRELLKLAKELDKPVLKNKVFQGDCFEVLKTFPDNYFDSLVCDPPGGISFMQGGGKGKTWDSDKGGMLNWINWLSEIMSEAMRTMKPGACGLVWSIPRTSHWTGMALELAGFRLIDCVHHCFGSGFPKGQDISKHLQKLDATIDTKQWDGWKTPAPKPAVEGWWLVQKPISESSIARNILKHGVGGLNIEACRIESQKIEPNKRDRKTILGKENQASAWKSTGIGEGWDGQAGRYPANLILSCSADCDGDNHSPDCPVSVIGEQSGICTSGEIKPTHTRTTTKTKNAYSKRLAPSESFTSNTGTAARYFKQLPFDPETVNSVYYQAKASTKDRTCNGTVENTHPTVKSTALMEYFIKLITPPGGIVLDPFGGSGTTGVAAKKIGFNYVLIEKEQEYVDIINKRLENV